MEQMNAAAGLTTEKYTVWIDGQHIMRKAVITGTGTTLTETVALTFTSVNQPVNITVPPTSQTTTLPSRDLG
jgi:polyisoprenoid-binding protein YceI